MVRARAGSGRTGLRRRALKPVDVPSFEDKPNWFSHVAEECRAIRERAVLIDQTSFAKFEITGAGTEAALQRIAANDLSGPPGKAVYTQLCNEKGGIEADVTLVHVGPDHFYLITGSGFGVRDSGWVAKHLPSIGADPRRHECAGGHQYLRAAFAGYPAIGDGCGYFQCGVSVFRGAPD